MEFSFASNDSKISTLLHRFKKKKIKNNIRVITQLYILIFITIYSLIPEQVSSSKDNYNFPFLYFPRLRICQAKLTFQSFKSFKIYYLFIFSFESQFIVGKFILGKNYC